MVIVTHSRVKQVIGRVQETWSEFDYVQRRLFEIRTGVPVVNREERHRVGVDELEALFALEPNDPRP